MNFRITLILLIVLIALGGYLYWSGRNQTDTAENGESQIETVSVLELNPEDIQGITVTSPTSGTLSLSRSSDTWNITDPLDEPANSVRVTQVVSDVAGLSATRIITPTDDNLAQYGLDTPAYTVDLVGDGDTLATLHLGNASPSGSGTYIQVDTSPTIYLVPSIEISDFQEWVSTPPLQPTPIPTMPPLPTVELDSTPMPTEGG